jgi:hypothetical protein
MAAKMIRSDEVDRLLAALFAAFPPTADDQTKSGSFDASSIGTRAPNAPPLLAALAPFEPRVISRGTILAQGRLDKRSTDRIRVFLDGCPYEAERVFGGWVLMRDRVGWCYVRSTSGRVVPITGGAALR